MNVLKQLFVVSRPISWLNTAYPFAAAYFIIFQSVDVRFVVGTLFFLIPYNLLMYGVNDVYDYESDILNPRKGGIEGAQSAKALHRPILWSSALLTVPFVLALLVMSDIRSAIVLLGVLFFVLAYSVPYLRFKERPFLDSVTSSIHFSGPLVYALALAGFPAEAWLAVASFFCWGMASHAFGAVQDVVPDREGGISSIATVLGARNTVRFSIVLYALSAVLLVAYGLPVALLSLIGVVYILNIAPYRSVSDTDSGRANKAWRRFIYLNYFSGFLVTMMLIRLFVFG